MTAPIATDDVLARAVRLAEDLHECALALSDAGDEHLEVTLEARSSHLVGCTCHLCGPRKRVRAGQAVLSVLSERLADLYAALEARQEVRS